MSAPSVPVASPFPLLRVDLNNLTSPKLDIDETVVFEHFDDDNYARNKIHNISVALVKNAKQNRKTAVWGLPDLGTVEAVLAGLKENFPDCQVKLYPPHDKETRNTVRIFWS